MKKALLLLAAISTFACHAQKSQKYNLGFEQKQETERLSDGWMKWGDYPLTIDSLAHSGEKAGKITSDGQGKSFGSIAYQIPANYVGKTITLEGYMKIKNVEDGFAGLLMRIDGNGSSLEFDNMKNQKISGTTDWKKYRITLNYPEEAETIFVAGILIGKGEAWFDDFTLKIDGNNVQTLKERRKKLSKAALDKAFDDGSTIEFPELDSQTVANLALLGRVWGFVKYHHPEIARGNYNWDYELFRFLPKYMKASKETERDQLLINWITSLGPIPDCGNCKPTPSEAFIQPDHAWIQRQDKPLRRQLMNLYENRSQGKHYYIELFQRVQNPKFKNENAYAQMPYPDAGFRLLCLYRYWNMIHYFFPYKYLTDDDWNNVLAEYIPSFVQAANELEYEMAALQLIGDIQDTHANIHQGADKIAEWKGNNYPPVHTRFIEDQLVVTDYYNPELQEQVGLQVGDIITHINGIPVEELVAERVRYYPASNTAARLRELSVALLRSNAEEIDISVKSVDAVVRSQKLRLYPKDGLNVYRWYPRNDEKSYKMLSDRIGYVSLQNIKKSDVPQIKKEFKDTKGIIIDIRNYPSTFVPFSLGSYFVSSMTPFVKFTKGNVDNPGEFTFTDPLKIPSKGKTYQGTVVVLVNELSQSQAEYTAMAFRASDRTRILGSTTAGADGNVSPIVLPGGLTTAISGIGVYYPDGEETQRVGIVPDIEVKPTIEGVRQGKDELLEKAIALILGK